MLDVLGVHRCSCQCLPVCIQVCWMDREGAVGVVVTMQWLCWTCTGIVVSVCPGCRQVGWMHGREGAVGVVVTMQWLCWVCT